MTEPIDLRAGATQLITVVSWVPDEALGRSTPCGDYCVSDLLDHLGALSVAFTAAARKEVLGPTPLTQGLDPQWRLSVPEAVGALCEAWSDPAAWRGTTEVAEVEMPAETMAVVALGELVIHAWDLGAAIGVPTSYEGPGMVELTGWVRQFSPDGAPGLFGPAVQSAPEASKFEKLLALSGRDPCWEPQDV